MTGSPSGRGRSRLLAAAVVVAMAALTAVVYLLVRPDSPREEPEPLAAVAVTSSTRHQFDDLEGLLAASDLVISGRAVATERGRVFGGVGPDGAASDQAIRSRVVTIEVGEVLASRDPVADPPPGTVVLVEEEAGLLDGRPLVVDGVHRTRIGDAGIWFLAASGDPEFPGFTVVNSQGRYLLADPADESVGALRGGDRTDALVEQLASLGLDPLAERIRGAAGA